MSTTQSIIVYRNPMEQALWEGVMGAELFPIAVGAIFAIATVMAVSHIIDRFNGAFRKNWLGRNSGNVSLVVGGIVWFLVAKMMWL